MGNDKCRDPHGDSAVDNRLSDFPKAVYRELFNDRDQVRRIGFNNFSMKIYTPHQQLDCENVSNFDQKTE